ncbi:pentafunctional AROM polypeptide [Chiua virens]|nr:pentafunctional AROM polypeptide [Chiua virens]
MLGKDTIRCSFHLQDHIAETLLSDLPATRYVLITDTNIAPLYLPLFVHALNTRIHRAFPDPTAAPHFITHVIPPGETANALATPPFSHLEAVSLATSSDTSLPPRTYPLSFALQHDRFSAACAGARVVQIPTSLLATVDPAIGGKTAVDTPLGEILTSAFWQPEYIFIDVAFLASLPKRELANGLAEIIKTAAVWDEGAFALLESSTTTLLDSLGDIHAQSLADLASHPLLTPIISSAKTKAAIVSLDPQESHLRNLVNFGHTIGHAVEAFLTPYLLHGECVAMGTVLEAEIARGYGRETGFGQVGERARAASAPEMTTDGLLDRMGIDKKNTTSKLKKIVLLFRIGKTHELRATGIPDDEIRKVLADGVTVVSGIPSRYVKPDLPIPLWELPGVADKGPLPPQLIPSPPVVTHLTANNSGGIPHITLTTPGSQSISNRALVLAALSNGTVKLKNLLHSDDAQVMIAALQTLKAAAFEWADNDETLVVTGSGGKLSLPPPGAEIYLGNAGTAARFPTTACTHVSPSDNSSASDRTVITGNSRMKQRAIAPLVEALSEASADISYFETSGCLLLSIAPKVFLVAHSPLMLPSHPHTPHPFSSIPCGIYTVSKSGVFTIESDASSATYPLAVAAVTGISCVLVSIGFSSLQGDARFAKEVLEPMGCAVVQTAAETTATGPPIGTLKAMGEVDMEPMTDRFLTAAVVGAIATDGGLGGEGGAGKNVLRIRGIVNQRVKECNRINFDAPRFEQVKTFKEWLLPNYENFTTSSDKFDETFVLQTYSAAVELLCCASCYGSLLELSLSVLSQTSYAGVVTAVGEIFHRFATVWTAMNATSGITHALHAAHMVWRN